jgi:hypothetical protein
LGRPHLLADNKRATDMRASFGFGPLGITRRDGLDNAPVLPLRILWAAWGGEGSWSEEGD